MGRNSEILIAPDTLSELNCIAQQITASTARRTSVLGAAMKKARSISEERAAVASNCSLSPIAFSVVLPFVRSIRPLIRRPLGGDYWFVDDSNAEVNFTAHGRDLFPPLSYSVLSILLRWKIVRRRPFFSLFADEKDYEWFDLNATCDAVIDQYEKIDMYRSVRFELELHGYRVDSEFGLLCNVTGCNNV